MTKRLLLAVALCLAMVAAGPVTAAATATTEGKAKLSATLLDKKVKVNNKARIKGELEMADTGARTLTPIVVQKLVAGVWVDVTTSSCRPNYTFRLNVSFSISAEYSLRIYHPSTSVYSNTMVLVVI
jgi:hypothetical protein